MYCQYENPLWKSLYESLSKPEKIRVTYHNDLITTIRYLIHCYRLLTVRDKPSKSNWSYSYDWNLTNFFQIAKIRIITFSVFYFLLFILFIFNSRFHDLQVKRIWKSLQFVLLFLLLIPMLQNWPPGKKNKQFFVIQDFVLSLDCFFLGFCLIKQKNVWLFIGLS